jgi:hypothetical protein
MLILSFFNLEKQMLTRFYAEKLLFLQLALTKATECYGNGKTANIYVCVLYYNCIQQHTVRSKLHKVTHSHCGCLCLYVTSNYN